MESYTQLQGVDLISGQHYVLDYTNHQGTRAQREIELVKLFWGTDLFHRDKPQMILVAKAMDRNNEHRNFALSGVHSIRPVAPSKPIQPQATAKTSRSELSDRLDRFDSELSSKDYPILKAIIADCRSSICYAAPELTPHLWVSIPWRIRGHIGIHNNVLLCRFDEIMNAPRGDA